MRMPGLIFIGDDEMDLELPVFFSNPGPPRDHPPPQKAGGEWKKGVDFRGRGEEQGESMGLGCGWAVL